MIMTKDIQFITYKKGLEKFCKHFLLVFTSIALVMFGSCVGWEDTADQDDN